MTPLFSARHDLTLEQCGEIATAVSLAALLGPLVFARLARSTCPSPRLIFRSTLATVVAYTLLVPGTSLTGDVILIILTGLLVGAVSLQYAEVSHRYPRALTGTALSLFNTLT